MQRGHSAKCTCVLPFVFGGKELILIRVILAVHRVILAAYESLLFSYYFGETGKI